MPAAAKRRAKALPKPGVTPLEDDSNRASFVGDVFARLNELTDKNIESFAQAVFEEFRKAPPERDESRLVRFMAIALKARDQHIRVRSVDLARDRFYFNAAKQALSFAGQLQRISDSTADDHAKIEEAMSLLFGTPVNVDA
jgi:hypothetical protein